MTLGRLQGVPVLGYHRILPAHAAAGSGARYGVPVSSLRQQLQLVRDLGMNTVSPEDIAAKQLPAKPVSFTFDDGYTSDYELALALFSEFSATATFFLITGSVGRDGFLTWQMAAEMLRRGMRLGSHSHSHLALSALSADKLRDELRRSREILEQQLSAPVHVLAAPYGFCDAHVLKAAWEGGYRVVCNSRPWPAQPGKNVVSRVAVLENTSLAEFRRLLENDATVYLRRWGRDRALAVPKSLLLRFRPASLGVRTAEDSL
jgi:peptidoglycan/xylan/chitin deacetylase (PgdA/CDA1 family)